ncbi:response regulator transcription factor [Congregibacter brevis]|uniref:Response regulator transcription factor n=1 Tax=Congregibacter brevis TaxID=3081201 RepID=A0ABZ0IIV4_9GAMM|nr:response regulator transcription factor [Congregibacter sp. IMCC45268]
MKILVVDDHALFREGLCHLLKGLETSVRIIEAQDAASAFAALDAHQDLDLMLLDLNMPGADGFSILATASKNHPTVPIAVLSASVDQADVDRVMQTSAMGYIHKNTSTKVMLGAVRLILDGGVYTPPSSSVDEGVTAKQHTPDTLTPRQSEVLSKVAAGASNKQIAATLDITEATAKMHLSSIFKALGVKNRTQAALVAKKMNLDIPIN